MLSALLLVGCTSKKEFSGAGIKIELNDTFTKKTVIQAPFYLESPQHIVMGLRETKSDLSSHGIGTLNEYIVAVLRNGNKLVPVEESDEDESFEYYFAYYTSSVEDQDFGYMLVVLEGEDHFYSITFGCLESNLEKNKDTYFKWLNTITVE